MENLNLNSVDLGDLLAELDEVAASKTKGGKKVPEFSDTELAMITKLAQVSVNGGASQRDIVKIYKSAFKAGIHTEKFTGAHAQRTPASFERKFIEVYKQVKAGQ